MSMKAIVKQDRILEWLRVTIMAVVISTLLLIGFVFPASAGGATQISGIGYFAEPGECNDPVMGPNGQGPDIALNMTGDLNGCHYVFVETSTCSPGGIYQETGTEMYVGSGASGDKGTFQTTYRFTAKFVDCTTLAEEIHGRCQHPIIAGSGTGDFEGVTGRLDFKDDIENLNFPFRGHLQ
jgi:hypothetical protein